MANIGQPNMNQHKAQYAPRTVRKYRPRTSGPTFPCIVTDAKTGEQLAIIYRNGKRIDVNQTVVYEGATDGPTAVETGLSKYVLDK